MISDANTNPAIKTAGGKYSASGFVTATVTVLAAATTGTATVPTGAVVLSILPTGNQDQLVDNVAVSSTTLTVTLAAAATADNTFKVFLLAP